MVTLTGTGSGGFSNRLGNKNAWGSGSNETVNECTASMVLFADIPLSFLWFGFHCFSFLFFPFLCFPFLSFHCCSLCSATVSSWLLSWLEYYGKPNSALFCLLILVLFILFFCFICLVFFLRCCFICLFASFRLRVCSSIGVFSTFLLLFFFFCLLLFILFIISDILFLISIILLLLLACLHFWIGF